MYKIANFAYYFSCLILAWTLRQLNDFESYTKRELKGEIFGIPAIPKKLVMCAIGKFRSKGVCTVSKNQVAIL